MKLEWMKQFVASMADNDLYKFSQQMAFLERFHDAKGIYKFKNRGKQRFNEEFLEALKYQIEVNIPRLAMTESELLYLRLVSPFLKHWYIEFLRTFRYNPKNIKVSLDYADNKNLVIVLGDIKDEITLAERMMWEVVLMAVISELYFLIIDTNWTMEGQVERARDKAQRLSEAGCIFTDFGTRRRRNLATQDIVVREMMQFKGFVGTSNVHLSHKYNLIPKGTQAHEWFMAMQVLESIRHSNYYGMLNWVRVYNGALGTALPDTLGSEQFLKNFDMRFAKLFDGVRWDSGDEYWFTDLFVDHYKKLGIDPMTKTIIYSNALDVERSIKINEYCKGKIRCAFGIGTFFTNSFDNSPPLNMVIKLHSVNGIPVVKFSDDKGKLMGDNDAIRATRWECFGTPLDEK